MLRLALALAACASIVGCSNEPDGSGGGGTGGTTTPGVTCDPAPAGDAVPFVDVTAEWGLDFVHHSAAELCDITDTVGGPGVCAFDFDGDSDVDLYFLDRAGFPNRLYRNDGGAFTDVTDESGAGLLDDSHACLAFDHDADGDLDLFIGNAGQDRLLRNDGGTFIDVTAEVGLAADGYTTTATAGDIDLDGDLDLFVGRLVTPESCPPVTCSPTPKACAAEANSLYLNDGGQLVDVAEERGLTHVEPTLASVFFDVDLDGDLDLFVGNDIGSKFPDRLYRNDGSGSFKDAAQGLGLELYGTDTMGVDVGDADGDGVTDLVTSDFEGLPVRLVTCKDPALPCDMVGISQESTESVKWAIALVDVDHDGDLDVFHTSGHVNVPVDYPGDLHQLHWNDGEGVFTHHAPSPGEALSERDVGRGAAFADLDGDQDVDVVIAGANGPARIWLNQAAGGHALMVELDSLSAGAKVTVSAGGASRMEHAIVGGGYAGSSDPRVHFGLATACVADVTVEWPGGDAKTVTSVLAGQVLRVERD